MRIDRFIGPYAWLSNFHYEPGQRILLDSRPYPTVEHAYQAAKSFDNHYRAKIALIFDPGVAKRWAKRNVVYRPDWPDVKIDLMRNLLRKKFNNIRLCRLLLETGDAEIIEGNTWNDVYWGVCNGVGRNHLGELIMEIRDAIANPLP